jgi:hypothetical protein
VGTSSDGGGAPTAGASREYRLVSATYRERTYPDGILVIDDARREIELRQRAEGKKKAKAPATIVRFTLQPNAEVTVDGPLLRVSELSISFESPAVAAEVAEILRRPAKDRVAMAMQGLSEAESALAEFLLSREQAVTFLSRLKANPREALLGAESLWPPDATDEPLDSVYSSYSARLADALEKMTSSLAGAEKKLGARMIERIYALAYTIGAIQNALLEGDLKQDRELAALQELGIAATAQDLGMEKPTESLLQRAHPVLVGIVTEQGLQR